jgi:outer membrane protein assembly factor BamB
VENNYGYAGVQSTLLGKTTSPGVAKVDLEDDGSCHVAWTNPVSAPTSVPKVSLGNGLLYVYSKPASFLLDDSWYFTAIDVRTGATRWKQRTGNGVQWNNHYASIYLGPDGAAYMPTVAGLIRFQDQ